MCQNPARVNQPRFRPSQRAAASPAPKGSSRAQGPTSTGLADRGFGCRMVVGVWVYSWPQAPASPVLQLAGL